MKKSKRYVESAKLVDSNKDYEIKEALDIIEKCQKQNLIKQLNYMLN